MNKANIYDLRKDSARLITPHFKVREFSCKSRKSNIVIVNPDLVELLEKIRSHFGKPIIINSAYRTESHNKAVGGAEYSQHLYGNAADIWMEGVTPYEISAYAEKLLPGRGGIGVYKTFVHIDMRDTKSRWRG